MFGMIRNFKYRSCKLNTINDLTDLNFKKSAEINKKYKILVIDDQGFNQEENLKRLGYKDITVVYDFENIDKIMPYDIIFCDINGVGVDLDEKYQGAAVAKKIKITYPNKVVIIFSAAEQSLSLNEYYSFVDGVISKNLNVQELASNIDNYIEKLDNPIMQWLSFKKLLESRNIATKNIAIFEHYYVKSIQEGKDYTEEIERHIKYNDNKLNSDFYKHLPIILKTVKEMVSVYASI